MKSFSKSLSVHGERNIKFNLRKIQFRKPQVKYLGNIISDKGMQIDPEKDDVIINMPQPESTTDLQRFLDMVNYLRQFIPNLSEITTPLRSLLKKNTKWLWSHEHTSAMNTIKEILKSKPVLSFFDTNKEIVLQVDASSHGLGACILQKKHPGFICFL